MKKLTIIMSLYVSLSINFAANIERFRNPDFATYATGQDKQGNKVEVYVAIHGSEIIVTGENDFMVYGLDKMRTNSWGLVDQCNKAVADFLQRLGASRHVLMDGSW